MIKSSSTQSATQPQWHRVSQLQQRFHTIAKQTMVDLPLNRDGIVVEALSFTVWQDGFLGILITPWTMNLTYLPHDVQAQTHAIGTKQRYQFGENSLEFITTYDDELGQYQVCSLESPIVSFSTQAEAKLIAKMIMDNLLPNPQQTTEKNVNNLVSRRAFLRGKLS